MSYQHYDKQIGGQKLDVYRICREYGVTDPAIFQSIKKLLRCGQAHKDARQDVIEARDGLNRWLEMDEEDNEVSIPKHNGGR